MFDKEGDINDVFTTPEMPKVLTQHFEQGVHERLDGLLERFDDELSRNFDDLRARMDFMGRKIDALQGRLLESGGAVVEADATPAPPPTQPPKSLSFAPTQQAWKNGQLAKKANSMKGNRLEDQGSSSWSSDDLDPLSVLVRRSEKMEGWLQHFMQTLTTELQDNAQRCRLSRVNTRARLCEDGAEGDRPLAEARVHVMEVINGFCSFFSRLRRLSACNWTRNGVITALSTILILTNAAFLSIAENHRMEAALLRFEEPTWIRDVEIVFVCMFIAELLFKIVVYREAMFVRQDILWHLFDAGLIFTAILELTLSSVANLSFGRTLRVLRVLRVGKVLRLVGHLRTLRLMVAMIGSALVALFWCMVSIIMLTYVAAIFFMGRLTNYLDGGDIPDKELVDKVEKYFKNFNITVRTIVAAITGGVDWMDVAEPFTYVGSVTYAMWVTFILLVVFGLMNILTGIVVESTKKHVEIDRDLVIEEIMKSESTFFHQLIGTFQTLDQKHSGFITEDALRQYLSQPHVHFYLQSIGVKPKDAMHVFQLLEEERGVLLEDYVQALVYYHDEAKAIDVAMAERETKSVVLALQKAILSAAKASAAYESEIADCRI